jgi:hypothetical protein
MHMKIFLAEKHMDKQTAAGHLIVNTLVIPGLGSIMAGRKKVGLIQLTLSCFGVLISVIGTGILISQIYRDGMVETLQNPDLSWIALGLGGMIAFVIAWIWALITSIQMISKIKK